LIYIYTVNVNGFDNLRPPAVPADDFTRYICFTNVPNLPRVYPWEYRPIYDVGEPCRTARVPKILPHLMLPEDAEYSVYHDGNFQLRMDPRRMIDELLSGGIQWAAHRHPCRNCIYEEGELLVREGIGTRELVEAEIGRYRAAGFPEKQGLWANGLLVRRHTPETNSLNERWWKLYSEGCERDQLSFPVARRECDVTVRTIDENVWASTYILFRWHAPWRHRDDNPDYWPERDRTRRRLAELARVTGTSGGIRHIEE
jgi:hypothetical protein